MKPEAIAENFVSTSEEISRLLVRSAFYTSTEIKTIADKLRANLKKINAWRLLVLTGNLTAEEAKKLVEPLQKENEVYYKVLANV
jgi:hypothetical protein